MINFQKYYRKYLEYNEKDKIFNRYDPKLEEASKYLEDKKFLSIDDLFEIARWKSPRKAKSVYNNNQTTVENATKKVFGSNYPEREIKLLDDLKGVGIPTASAILCVYNPKDYGVIDINAWNALSRIDNIFSKKRYSQFSINDYKNYLTKIRFLAKQNKMTCRQIDMALWAFGKKNKCKS